MHGCKYKGWTCDQVLIQVRQNEDTSKQVHDRILDPRRIATVISKEETETQSNV